MIALSPYPAGLTAMTAVALLTWLVSLRKRNVSIVDSVWSLMILLGATVYVWLAESSSRALAMWTLVALWALRLAIYITARNWGAGEDRRYQAIRRRNEPNFAVKSFYLVFLLQAVLAWIVSLPLWAIARATNPLGALDYLGIAIVLFGFGFEAIGDWQLARFKADDRNRGQVMDRGLWRYTRHPNYFGECCIWWGFYAMALSTGAWWSIVGPLLMTGLLLKVSGVALLERDIAERRPQYRDYIERTNAFFPWPRKLKA